MSKNKEQAETCNKYVQSGLTRDMTVQFLLKKLVGMGCKPPEGFIKCMDCGNKMAGAGFGMVEEISVVPDAASQRRADTPQCQRTAKDLQDQLQLQKEGKAELKLLPEIFLCQQHLRSETHAHQSMVHELIHAVDMCRYARFVFYCILFVSIQLFLFSIRIFLLVILIGSILLLSLTNILI